VHAHLATQVGGAAALAFGVALMASGLSSSSVGIYAGQVVMAGFMNWRIPLLLITRDPATMTDMPNRTLTTTLMTATTVIATGLNLALLYTAVRNLVRLSGAVGVRAVPD
jgi:manganese transport protein